MKLQIKQYFKNYFRNNQEISCIHQFGELSFRADRENNKIKIRQIGGFPEGISDDIGCVIYLKPESKFNCTEDLGKFSENKYKLCEATKDNIQNIILDIVKVEYRIEPDIRFQFLDTIFERNTDKFDNNIRKFNEFINNKFQDIQVRKTDGTGQDRDVNSILIKLSMLGESRLLEYYFYNFDKYLESLDKFVKISPGIEFIQVYDYIRNLTSRKNKQILYKYIFFHSIISGRISYVRMTMHEIKDINITYKNGNTALHLASKHGHEGVVRLLLNRNFRNELDLNIKNDKDETVFQIAKTKEIKELFNTYNPKQKEQSLKINVNELTWDKQNIINLYKILDQKLVIGDDDKTGYNTETKITIMENKRTFTDTNEDIEEKGPYIISLYVEMATENNNLKLVKYLLELFDKKKWLDILGRTNILFNSFNYADYECDDCVNEFSKIIYESADMKVIQNPIIWTIKNVNYKRYLKPVLNLDTDLKYINSRNHEETDYFLDEKKIKSMYSPLEYMIMSRRARFNFEKDKIKYCIDLLLEHKADINQKINDDTIFYRMVASNRDSAFKIIIDYYESQNIILEVDNETIIKLKKLKPKSYAENIKQYISSLPLPP